MKPIIFLAVGIVFLSSVGVWYLNRGIDLTPVAPPVSVLSLVTDAQCTTGACTTTTVTNKSPSSDKTVEPVVATQVILTPNEKKTPVVPSIIPTPNPTPVPEVVNPTVPVVSPPPTKVTAVPYIELVSPDGYLNSEPFTLADYIGKKVILFEFITYTCINCQRTFPYLKSWYEKYQDKGLIVIGIHTPEFAYERDRDNVAAALKKEGITFPVVQDNDYQTWNAYGNRFWPHRYIIDMNGNIVFDHVGEGAYAETEKQIQLQLALLNNRSS